MGLVYIPHVGSAAHCDAFRRILKDDFPVDYDAYQKWYLRRKADTENDGHQCKDTPVNPQEFEQFCNTHPHKRTFDGFLEFTSLKGGAV
jgi:hypothetical protein